MTLKHTAVVTLSVLTSPALQAAEPLESSGEENYTRFCAACHGAGAKGDGPVASAIVKTVPDLTGISARNGGSFPRDRIANAIDGRWTIDAHGTQMMPVWGYEFWTGGGDFSEVAVRTIIAALSRHPK